MHPFNSCHPSQIIIRTYALALSLSLGPSLVPIIISLFNPNSKSPKTTLLRVQKLLRTELGVQGFASSITLSVGGGVVLQNLWRRLDRSLGTEGIDQQQVRQDPLHNTYSVRTSARNLLTGLNPTPSQKTFITTLLSAFIGILLLQSGRRRRLKHNYYPKLSDLFPLASATADTDPTIRASPTLDLTLLLFVRATDAFVQRVVQGLSVGPNAGTHNHKATRSAPNESTHVPGPADHILADRTERSTTNIHIKNLKVERRKKSVDLSTKIDAFVFWACSARIMWCFFYEPQRLPRSYVKWIKTLANLDDRILQTLRLIREGKWVYSKLVKEASENRTVLTTLSKDLGFSTIWGDPAALPAYGGALADRTWKRMGLTGRSGVGGMPCHIVHGKVTGINALDGSCTANAAYRGALGFLEASALYLPVHFLPTLFTKPSTLLRPTRAVVILSNALRSASFLSAFIATYWYAVCLTRSVVLARLFPFVSHNFWDGPYGGIMAGCLACGGSIWIENGRRRGEMALYVLPRALRACLPQSWLRGGNNRVAILVERITFVVSLAYLLSAGMYRPETLRGLSHWTLAFITNGPNVKFWESKKSKAVADSEPISSNDNDKKLASTDDTS